MVEFDRTQFQPDLSQIEATATAVIRGRPDSEACDDVNSDFKHVHLI